MSRAWSYDVGGWLVILLSTKNNNKKKLNSRTQIPDGPKANRPGLFISTSRTILAPAALIGTAAPGSHHHQQILPILTLRDNPNRSIVKTFL